jgi:7,8-dihydroneopterin aldolase/epimerase/oxygenase
MSNLLTIELKQLHFFAFHGLYEEEKKTGNEFEVNLSVDYKPDTVVISEIADTINYAELFDLVKAEMQKPRDLLETLAMEIVELIHSLYPQITKAVISITKLHPPIAAFTGSVGVKYKKEW